MAPISYVGYETEGYRTVSREGSRRRSHPTTLATSSLVPTQAATPSTPTSTPKRRAIHPTAASRSRLEPMDGG
jgi:hypothetical protein